ncbi:outer membrane protein [Methylocapsa acidiphila]|uniref:outer membrane protein n=1 Tax=Methylocapsa acidiphila TaxID=133552 RepID=UPI00042705B0|nr:outer membrane protein [Methylocapsa acidiphila]
MLRRLLLASVGAIALGHSAAAADLPSRAPIVAPPPPFTWTGIYIGAQIGYVWANDPSRLNFPGAYASDFGIDSAEFIYPQAFSFSSNPGGVIGGAHIGYNQQFGMWVLGLEGDVDGSSLSRTYSVGGYPFWASATERQTIQGSIRGRVGVAFDRVLLYGTGGVAFADFENDHSANVFGSPYAASISTGRTGWTVGGGLEYAVTNNWSVRAEYRYSDFGHYTLYPNFANIPVYSAGTSVTHHPTENRVQVGFSYKFDPPAPPAPVVAKY